MRREFLNGKRGKPDVREFELRLTDHLSVLHNDLRRFTYRHSGYQAFKITDPKPRDIHKASVRDRLLHHATHRQLYPFFDKTFIADSYSCRKGKGTHKAMNRFREFAGSVSRNGTRTCWVLKLDIQRFFASIDQDILMDILRQHIPDRNVLWLLERVIESFTSTGPGKGLPLGNLTSQLLVNIYMNELDQFAKHTLKAKFYIRYADDIAILSHDYAELKSLIPRISEFLNERLKLELHPHKVSIGTLAAGVDFLGWVHFHDHRVLRTTTKRRMRDALTRGASREAEASYFGMLKHGNTRTLETALKVLSLRK